MNRRIIKRWIDALRSGKYKQGRGCLRRDDNFCCLGVLCDLYINSAEGKRNEAQWTQDKIGWLITTTKGSSSGILPWGVMKWAGLDSNDVLLGDKEASVLNDKMKIDGTHSFTFKHIANRIEKYILGAE